MIGFNGAFGRKPRKFGYTPRYFDAQAEKRADRRRKRPNKPEHRQPQNDTDNGGACAYSEKSRSYAPGEYVRANADRRGLNVPEEARTHRRSKSQRRTILFCLLTAVLLWLLWVL